MTLIVGLGNPGKKYSATLHNVGFMTLDKLAQKNGVNWTKHSTISLIGKLTDALLLKPQTFMNESGQSVSEIVNYYKISPAELWIIHDDLDITAGEVRLSFGASSAGHKGVQNIINHLGTTDFWRFRIGIGRPPAGLTGENYVLTEPSGETKEKVESGLSKAGELLQMALKQGIAAAQKLSH